MKHPILVFALLLAIPAFAQHRGGAGQQNPGRVPRPVERPHAQRPPEHRQPEHVTRPVERQHREHVRQHQPEYRGQIEARNRYYGHRIDRVYFHEHFENRHFFWRHCRWYGRPYYIGSRFYFDGFWFMIVERTPEYWDDEEVIIVEYSDGYYLYNTRYQERIFIAVSF